MTSGVTGSGSCPYTKDNVYWGGYHVTIPMPSGTGASTFLVIMEFDADTTIVSDIVQTEMHYLVRCNNDLIAGKLSQQLSEHTPVFRHPLHG